MKIVLFVLSNFFVFAAAAMISDIMFAKRGRWFRFLALLCFAAVGIIWIELGTGLAGRLTFPVVSFVAGGVFVLTGAVWLAVNRRRMPRRIFSRRILLMSVFLIAGLGLGWLAGQYDFQGTHFCQDDLNYHASAVAHWYAAKDISADTYNYHAYKPLNAELFSLWFLLPFGQDGLVFLSGLFWMVLVCAAAIVLMQNMGVDRKWFGPVIFSFFCCDVVLCQATRTFTAVDLAGPAMVLSAVAFLSSIPELSPARRWPYILLAGLCAGFAFGTKVPFVTVFGVLAIWVFWAIKDNFTIRLGNIFLFVLVAVAVGAYWYIRNLILTGNPVFPGELGPFKGPLTRDIQFDTSLFGHIVNSGFDISVILEILRQHLAWPLGVFILSAAGLVTGVIFLGRKTEPRKTVSLLLCVAVVMLITYSNMPFSGQNDGRDGPLIIAPRFIIGPFVIGLILFSLLLSGKSSLRWGWYCLYVAGLILAVYACPNPIQVVVGIAVLCWFFLFSLRSKWMVHLSLPWMLYPAFLLPTGLCWGIALNFPVLQAKANQRLFMDRQIIVLNLGDAWQKIDMLPVGSKVTAFGPLAYCYYPHFGRHFQLCPQPLLASLKPYQPLHLRWKNDPAHTVWWPKVAVADSNTWMDGLIQSGAEYILVQRSSDGPWPQPDEILRRFDNAEKIDSGDNWILWEIKR